MSDSTPLTEEEKGALRIARHAHTSECLGRSLASPRRSDFDSGYLAARAFYSERERALRGVVSRIVDMDARTVTVGELAAIRTEARAALEKTDA